VIGRRAPGATPSPQPPQRSGARKGRFTNGWNSHHRIGSRHRRGQQAHAGKAESPAALPGFRGPITVEIAHAASVGWGPATERGCMVLSTWSRQSRDGSLWRPEGGRAGPVRLAPGSQQAHAENVEACGAMSRRPCRHAFRPSERETVAVATPCCHAQSIFKQVITFLARETQGPAGLPSALFES